MINVKELRIGNYVKDDFGRIGYIIALGTKKATVNLEFSRLTISYDELEPIALTEDILLKLGSNKSEQNNNHFWYATNNNYMIDIKYFDKGYYYMVNQLQSRHIKSIHHLQNLVHALSGEELTLKQ